MSTEAQGMGTLGEPVRFYEPMTITNKDDQSIITSPIYGIRSFTPFCIGVRLTVP